MKTLENELSVTEDLAKDFVRFYSTFDGAQQALTPDVLFDINVPGWRFQIQGPESFVGWLKGYSPRGYQLSLSYTVPTSEGFVAEIEGTYSSEGQELYFRNLLVCRVNGERIDQVIYYCTGDWDPDTRAHHKREVHLLRP